MAIIAALPKHATIHGDTIQVLPDITRDFSYYLNILRESGGLRETTARVSVGVLSVEGTFFTLS